MRSTKPLVSAWALIISAVAVIGASGQEKLELRARLKPGQTYRQAVVVEAAIEQGPTGTQQKTTMQTGAGMSYRVGQVLGNGRIDARVEYEWFSIHLTAPDGRLDYDSRTHKGEVPVAAQAVAAMVNQGFEVTLEPNGSVQALRGVEQMVENIVRRLTVPSGPVRDALEQGARQQFSEAAIRQMMEFAFVFPPQAISIGESWRKTVTPPGSNLPVENVYTLRKREGGKAFIGVAAQVGVDTRNQAPGSASPIQMAVSGSQQGDMIVDEATGWLMTGQIIQDITGTMQGLPVKMNTVIKFTGQ